MANELQSTGAIPTTCIANVTLGEFEAMTAEQRRVFLITMRREIDQTEGYDRIRQEFRETLAAWERYATDAEAEGSRVDGVGLS